MPAMKRHTAAAISRPGVRLIQNSARQPSVSATHPPSVGPKVEPSMVTMPSMAPPIGCKRGGNAR